MPRGIAFYNLLVVALAASCFVHDAKKEASMQTAKPKQAKALIELFTSEGCSSCPPADKLLQKIATENDEDVIVLSFHVDYWNYLGWKDPFSQAAFSARQKNYVRHFSLESAYTPQMVVNGEEEFVGSDETRLRQALEKNKNLPVNISLAAKRKNDASVEVSYTLSSTGGVSLNLALVQPQASTVVARGENGGRTLQHVNVVRAFKTVEPKPGSGTVEIKIEEGIREIPLKIIAFTQQKKDEKITGAAQAEVM